MEILICLLFSIVAVDFATASCNINLKLKNETEYAIAIRHDMGGYDAGKAFQVRPWGAAWRDVDNGRWNFKSGTTSTVHHGAGSLYEVLESGKTTTDIYESVRGCGVKRRYRIDFTCHGVVEKSGGSGLAFAGEGKDVATKTRYFPGPKEWTESRNVTIPIKSCK